MDKKTFIKNNPDIKLTNPVKINGTLYVPLSDNKDNDFYDMYYVDDNDNVRQLTICQIDDMIDNYINDYVNVNDKNQIIDMDNIDVDIMNMGFIGIESDIVIGIQNKLKQMGFKNIINEW